MFGLSAFSSAPFSSLAEAGTPITTDVAYGEVGTLGKVLSLELSGVSAGGFVDSPSYGLTIQIAGVEARGFAGSTFAVYWKLIDDNQVANWQNVSAAQTPGWNLMDASQTNSWQNVENAQSGGWSLVLDEQTGVWVLVPAST